MTQLDHLLSRSISARDAIQAINLIRQNPRLLAAQIWHNYTPLQMAAHHGYVEMADQLQAAGAKLDLISAIYLARVDLVRTLVERNPVLLRKHAPCGLSPLHIAAAYGPLLEMVQVLLSLGANVNDANNNSRRTPLFLACTKPYEKAEFLLVYGADIQAQDKHGFTVLHNAAIYGDEELVDLLLRHGADLDAQTEGRQTP